MKISQFNKNDIIQRTASAADGDEKYIGRRIKFLGRKGTVIFVRFLNPAYLRNFVSVIAGTKWIDDNWDYFPEELYQELRVENKKRLEALRKEREEKEKKAGEEKTEE